MTPEEHLLRWLVSLKHDNAIRTINVMREHNLIDFGRLISEARQHEKDPHISPILNTIVESLLGESS